MGGMGSGSWYRHDKKSTVEESLALAVGHLRGRFRPGALGTLTWTWGGGNQSSVVYYVAGDGDALSVALVYRLRGGTDMRVSIRMQTTPTQFGGRRWWFTCPLVARGRMCNRRVGKVYLPPGARYFGCRRCHDLTYRSCQEAHQAERIFARLGCDAETGRLLAARWGLKTKVRE